MTNQKNNNTSPDGKWQITIDYYGNVNWVDLTKSNSTYTIEEVVDLPENLQKLMEFMEETGGDLEDYVKLNQDYSKLDENNLLKEYLTEEQ